MVGIVLVVIAIIVIAMVKQNRIKIYQAVSILLAVAFVAIVFGSTVFTRPVGARVYQLEVFWSWKEIFGIQPLGRIGSTGGDFLIVENLLNMILLMPFGVLLPFVMGRRLHWWQGLLAGLIVSTTVELSQLIFCRGLFEFDDMIHNSIGCMVGCICGSLLFGAIMRKESHRK